MKRAVPVAVLATGLLAGAVSVSGQGRPGDPMRATDLMVLAGRGSEIGAQIGDAKDGGVTIDEVRPESPAEKAGLKHADVIVEFDGERVRSARQFARLVQETPPGRTVKATIVRDGRRQEVQITPREGRSVLDGRTFDGDRLLERFGDLDMLRDQFPRGNFNFNYSMPDMLSGRRLGVTVDELTDQLSQYFGAKNGVLVTAVTDGSAASRAGLKAGDVITSIAGRPVHSREDLVRELRDARDEDVAICIVRDRKETSVTAKIEPPARRGRGVRI